MPDFHPIGFWVPCVLALLYVPMFVRSIDYRSFLYFATCGLATYLLPIWHADGVGFISFNLLVYPLYIAARTIRGAKLEKFNRLSVFLAPAFMSIAIPDFFLTMNRGGAEWTVGGAGWNDGLIRFWLFAVVIFAILFVLADWVHAMDNKAPFSWMASLSYHLNPVVATRVTTWSGDGPRSV